MRGLLALSVLVAVGVAPAPRQSTPRFKASTQTVSLYVTALEAGGRLVPDLSRDDFEVLDNGQPQTVTAFSNDLQPISIVIMLDMSGSMTLNLPLLRSAAVQLFTDLLPGDKARVGSFANRIILSKTFTNDVNELIHSLYLDLPQSGITPLWSAINVGMTAMSKLDGRRVVLVFTDGYDTSHGRPALKDVMTRTETEGFMIYGIGLEGLSRMSGGVEPPDPGLQQLANESGGGYFNLTTANDLAVTFKRVADELHRQYLIGFQTAATDGKLHTLEVRVRKPGLTARARKSYLAPRGSSGQERP